ncbi:reverse transcriptase domain-containing protein [Hazenella coriacea]|uniref:RNA-directed DNA polymerase n=1 Tax=Hazenella coriacea TaxID=1179467 RepID=A0A4R3L708_9BACL|nr:reverse transcriptase domain-containing protein [Hazenella coriacea]TCS94878.1 RNA-directed DNA polymerase [Hazenella coriacea]
MTEEQNQEEVKQLTREEWIERIKSEGRTEAIKKEMLRLGFWIEKPLTPEEKREQAEDELKLKQLQAELQELQKESAKISNLNKILKQARAKRIEESKKKRADRKAAIEKREADRKARWQDYKESHIVHVGDGLSAGLQSFETDEKKLMEQRLPLIRSAVQCADEMGITLSQLKWLTYHRDTATINHYYRFTIPKKNGGEREISSPKPLLRQAQAWIKAHILDQIQVHSAAYGFVPQINTVDNAKQHVNQAAVIKMDLKDFFPSITFWRVRGLFHSFGYSEAISTLFACLCTEPPRKEASFNGKIYHVALGERQLPQGACTSPSITNILCRRLDERLTGLAQTNGFIYTRYADDLTFSCQESSLSKIGTLLNSVRNIVKFEGFTVNEEKTRVLRASRRQRVTGIVVNEKPNLTRQDLRRFRALLHNVEKNGLEAENRSNHPNFWAYIQGTTSYIRMVRPELGEKLGEQVERIAIKYHLAGSVVSK